MVLKAISKATSRNWQRLHVNASGKLMNRANKTQSTRHVVAVGYAISDEAQRLLSLVSNAEWATDDLMFTLCVHCLRHHGLYNRPHVTRALSAFNNYQLLDLQIPGELWDVEEDVLGFVYQSLLTEGERNRTGQYYTQHRVAMEMLNELRLKDGETFLDPCCGSGSFLLSVHVAHPDQLFGVDINPVAVMIATTNLLVKYRECEFEPHVYCMDFLDHSLFNLVSDCLPATFDYIYTNPPWGADKEERYKDGYPMVKSKEKASMFLIQSLRRLKPEGRLHFLLPMSLLKIKVHHDVRGYILRHSRIHGISIYDGRFDGVFTGYFSIMLSKENVSFPYRYIVQTAQSRYEVESTSEALQTNCIAYEALNELDYAIISKMESRRHDDLTHSDWALGIVTGNNKELVKPTLADGMEPVFTGKDVEPFSLHEVSAYIAFQPESFQQCAKEEFYRSSEKLIYRFIAKHPIVAYDDRQRLCLNSANILIPRIDGMSVKSVAALLNSSLYRYYYALKFPDIKVLKGNLQQLPFPHLTSQQNMEFTDIVTKIISGNTDCENRMTIDNMVYDLFGISQNERLYIDSKIG